MTIHEQDKEYLTRYIIIITIGTAVLAFLDVEFYMLLIIAGVSLLVALYIYWDRRRHMFLVRSMKHYVKNRDVPIDLEMAIVKAAYGNYRLGLVSFQVELEKNPTDMELKDIVSQFEQSIEK